MCVALQHMFQQYHRHARVRLLLCGRARIALVLLAQCVSWDCTWAFSVREGVLLWLTSVWHDHSVWLTSERTGAGTVWVNHSTKTPT